MKLPLFLAMMIFGEGAVAQIPDVAPFIELHPAWQVRSTKKSLFNWYDPTGRYSLVGVRMILESGYRVYVAQRLQKVDTSGDPDTVDEYYIESRGHWRIGKQYLPFGRRDIFRTTALAARLDTNLLLDQAPLAITVCDNGSGRTRGVVGRVGGVVGISAAIGNHFGIQATDMAQFRNLEDAPGIGRGYRLALGIDTLISAGSAQLTADWVSFRRGETSLDGNKDVSDLRLRFHIPDTNYRAVMAWSRDWTDRRDFLITEIEIKGNEHITYIPMIRFDGLGFRDFAFTAVMRF